MISVTSPLHNMARISTHSLKYTQHSNLCTHPAKYGFGQSRQRDLFMCLFVSGSGHIPHPGHISISHIRLPTTQFQPPLQKAGITSNSSSTYKIHVLQNQQGSLWQLRTGSKSPTNPSPAAAISARTPDTFGTARRGPILAPGGGGPLSPVAAQGTSRWAV